MILIRVKLTKQFDAQPLVECEKQLPLEKNKKNGECPAVAYGFLQAQSILIMSYLLFT